MEPASAPRSVPVGKVPEGAAHATALSGNVNTLNQDFWPFPAPPARPEGEGARIVHGNIGFGKGVGRLTPPAGPGKVGNSTRELAVDDAVDRITANWPQGMPARARVALRRRFRTR